MFGIDAWWGELTPALKAFWGVAIFTTTIFTLQTIGMLFGMDDSFDMPETDGSDGGNLDHGTFSLASLSEYLTFRNAIAFLLGLSWTGIAVLDAGLSLWVALLVGIMMGLVFVAISFGVMYFLHQFRSDGTLRTDATIGATGSVVIRIEGSDRGKVRLNVRGRIKEYYAVSENGESLPEGQDVRVVSLRGEQLVVKSM